MIAFVVDEDLGLVFQPAEGGAVDNPVAIALVGAAGRVFGLAYGPAAASRRIACVRRKAARNGRRFGLK
jgi:hypothetical protein